MNEHHKGPWIMDQDCEAKGNPTRSIRVKEFGETHLLATVHYPTTYIGSNGAAQREANARLIAAAPALLKALEKMLDLYEHDEGCTDLPQYRAAVKAVALAKG